MFNLQITQQDLLSDDKSSLSLFLRSVEVVDFNQKSISQLTEL